MHTGMEGSWGGGAEREIGGSCERGRPNILWLGTTNLLLETWESSINLLCLLPNGARGVLGMLLWKGWAYFLYVPFTCSNNLSN